MEGLLVKNQAGEDIKLAMQELWLSGELLPVGARLVARHVFESAEEDPEAVSILGIAAPGDDEIS